MAEINGQFSNDRTVDIFSDETPKTSSMNERIAALEQENRQLVHEKDVIEKRIADMKQSIEESNTEKSKLLNELTESKSEIKTLGSVAARAAELEGEVFRLQHDLISTTSELEEVNRELREGKSMLEGLKKEGEVKGREFEAVVAERDLLIEKLRKMEAKEEEYLNAMNEKEKAIGNLRVKVAKSGEDKKDVEALKARVAELERKLEDKEKVINGFEEKEREIVVGEGKSGRLMTGEIGFGWPVIAGSVVCGVGLTGLVCYLHQAKRN